jgi:hypothetical protein
MQIHDTPAKTKNMLSAETLMASASAATGLNDFGAADFKVGLAMLLSEAQYSGINSEGVAVLQAFVLGLLINRLRFEDELKHHPEILDEVLAPPIVITGLPRSGTTKLHRMFAVDPRLQSVLRWQAMNLAPFPEAVDKDGRDPRIAVGEQEDAILRETSPELLAGKQTQSGEVEEESQFLMEMGFEHILTALRWSTPGYQKWVESRSALPTYRYLRQQLQYLQWQNGRGDGRPFVLKSPLHLDHIDALLEVFPGAVLVHTHRDPKECLPSFMRLADLQRRMHYDHVDLDYIGKWVVDTFSKQIRRNLDLRHRLDDATCIVDLSFRSIVSDPLSGIRTALQHRGWDLPADTQSAMLAWEESHPADRFGKFRYNMSDYGITPDQIDAAFTEYRAQFGELL